MKTFPIVLPSNRGKSFGPVADLLRGLRLAVGLCVVWLTLQPIRVQAQAATNTPPVRVSYQGFLTDGTGTPLGQASPQNYTVDFRLYSSPNSVPVLWSERQVVTVDKGNFSVILGEGAPISAENNANLGGVIANSADASERYIGLTVTLSGGTQNTLQPRLRLLTTPYAFLATTARSLTDANGNNRLTWGLTGRGRMEVSGDMHVASNVTVAGTATVTGNVSVSGVISGNGSGLTGISLNGLPSIDANKITGVLTPANIPALDASKIASGRLSLDRIPQIPTTNISGPGAILSTYITNTLSGDRLFANNVGVGMSSGTPASRLQLVSSDLTGTGLRLDNTSAGGNNWLIQSAGANNGSGAGRLVVENISTGKIGLSVGTDGSVSAPNGLSVNSRPLVVNSGTENLRIIRGTVKLVYAGPLTITATVEGGTGFAPSANGNRVTVTFSSAFTSAPTVTASSSNAAFPVYDPPTTSAFVFILFNELSTAAPIASGTHYVHFIAIGP